MRIDSQLVYVPAPLSLVGGAGISIPSNVLDLLSSGVGTPPANIIGNVALFGEDLGVGGGFVVPTLFVAMGIAAATANAAALNIALQLAPDTGAAGGYLPGAWTTAVETSPIPVANLGAGAVLARLDFAPVQPVTLRPRFHRLLFSPGAGANFTAGTISFAGIVPARDDQSNKYAANNYQVK